MSFVKTADCETVTPLDENGKRAKVLERLGKPEATELEIARTAKEMGIHLGLKK